MWKEATMTIKGYIYFASFIFSVIAFFIQMYLKKVREFQRGDWAYYEDSGGKHLVCICRASKGGFIEVVGKRPSGEDYYDYLSIWSLTKVKTNHPYIFSNGNILN